tara:strand:- start:674 stop:1069 length:396 start_codon:yes stop_codon:yes gene_type:complete
MAVTLTRTTGAGGVMTIKTELDLYAGSPVDSTEWLKGFGTQYPGGGTDEFAASNSDGNAVAGLKLLVGECTLVQNGNVFTVGGDASIVQSVLIGGSGAAGKSLTAVASGGTITFTAEATIDTTVGFMAIVA